MSSAGSATMHPGELLIDVEQVSVTYRRMRDRTHSLKEYGLRRLMGSVRYDDHVALHEVSLQVRRGEVLGVVGANGAGKSTLIKLLARILPPSSGRVRVWGKVAPLVELGAGFEADLSARDNIVLYGSLLGGDPRRLHEHAEAMAAWAGLVEHLDVAVRNLSSGMVARLAMAVSTFSRPDVLLIDEILSVGDAAFKQRSSERLHDLLHGGAAAVLVSHDLELTQALSTRVLWLERGTVRDHGDPAAVVEAYKTHALAAAGSFQDP
jgi:ABC-2 type transport system ATP-binding protein